jgi:hypothetical protein
MAACGRTSTVKAGPNEGLVCAWDEPLKILGLLFRLMTQCSVRQAKLAKDKEVKVLYGGRSSQPPRPRVMRRYS